MLLTNSTQTDIVLH